MLGLARLGRIGATAAGPASASLSHANAAGNGDTRSPAVRRCINLIAMANQIDPACLAAIQPVAQQQAVALQPLVALLSALLTKVRNPGVTP